MNYMILNRSKGGVNVTFAPHPDVLMLAFVMVVLLYRMGWREGGVRDYNGCSDLVGNLSADGFLVELPISILNGT